MRIDARGFGGAPVVVPGITVWHGFGMRLLSVVPLSTLLMVVGCQRSVAPAVPVPLAPAGPPDFVHDDLPKAIAAALAEHKLVFVDAWAPWCHTCLSMQHGVLDTAALGAFADRVVFAAVDTDRPVNASFLKAHPVSLWPTFFVLDPKLPDGPPLAMHPGSMSLPATLAFIQDAVARRTVAAPPQPADLALARAHEALADGAIDGAVAAFDDALATIGVGDPRRVDVVLAAAWARVKSLDAAGCARFIEAHHDEVTGGAAFDLQGALLACADKLTDSAQQRRLRDQARVDLQALITSPPVGAAIDDRADGMATLAELETTLGNPDGAEAMHAQRLRLLEDAVAKATTEQQAQVHDYARMNSLFALGRGAEAVTLLQARAAAIPDDYEPRARLASALFRLQRFDEARVAIDDAIRLSYGPRRLRYLLLKADIDTARADLPAARAALLAVVNYGAALDLAMKAEGLVKTATERLRALDAVSTTPAPVAPAIVH